MSSTVSSSAAAVTTACANLYVTPTHDANCAMPYRGNNSDIMVACCKSADVISYYDNCGVYCLAVDQTVKDLFECLYDHGAVWQDVFCSSNVNATATDTGAIAPTSAQASVIAGTGTAADKTITGFSTTTSKSNGSSATSATSSSSSHSAAGRSGTPHGTFNTVGLAMGVLLFSAAIFGAQQI